MFPLKKQFVITNNTENKFLESYDYYAEIPVLPHPGAFSKSRKNHIHEGVDLYCNEGDSVYSMFDGIVLGIIPFTGEHAGSPWWNNTWAVLVQHQDFVLNYGEINPQESLHKGVVVKQGDCLGQVVTVLKKNKGRPCNMLHLEMYKIGTSKPIKSWDLGAEKANNLLNPTVLLMEYLANE